MIMNTLHLLTAVLLIHSAVTLQKCIPECHNVPPGGAVADPWNCNQFYLCLSNEVPNAEPVSCAPGEHFDPSANSCVDGSQCQPRCGGCQPDCGGHEAGDYVEDPMDCTQFYICVREDEPSSHPIKCQPPTGVFDAPSGSCVVGSTCDASCAAGACHIRCRGAGDMLANTKNCNEYFECDADLNVGAVFKCPAEKPYFNGWNCVESGWQCCTSDCSPYCYPGDVQIIDPYNCNRYYICLHEGPAQESNHFQCLFGQNFQASSSSCKTGAPCVTLCTEHPGTETTTRTTTPICDSTPTSTTPTTTESTTTDCVTSLICPDAGNYPMCQSCSEGYFECNNAGASGVYRVCSPGFLFNTESEYPFCVEAAECPYTPPLLA